MQFGKFGMTVNTGADSINFPERALKAFQSALLEYGRLSEQQFETSEARIAEADKRRAAVIEAGQSWKGFLQEELANTEEIVARHSKVLGTGGSRGEG